MYKMGEGDFKSTRGEGWGRGVCAEFLLLSTTYFFEFFIKFSYKNKQKWVVLGFFLIKIK